MRLMRTSMETNISLYVSSRNLSQFQIDEYDLKLRWMSFMAIYFPFFDSHWEESTFYTTESLSYPVRRPAQVLSLLVQFLIDIF